MIPAPALEVAKRLVAAGYRTVFVGGGVRDALLGSASSGAWDLGTAATPPQVMAVYPTSCPRASSMERYPGGRRAARSRARPSGPKARTRRAPSRSGRLHLRSARRPRRRDLTVNALGLRSGDESAGRSTRGPRRSRARRAARGGRSGRSASPRTRCAPLRVARLACRATVELEETERALCPRRPSSLAKVSRGAGARRACAPAGTAPRPTAASSCCARPGCSKSWLPELAACYGVPQNRFHAYDVYEHSLRTLRRGAGPQARACDGRRCSTISASRRPRWSGDGDRTFYGHAHARRGDRRAPARAPELPALRARRDRAPRARAHVRLPAEWTDAALRRWIRRVGVDAVADLFDLRIADVVGTGRLRACRARLEEMRVRIERLLAGPRALTVLELAVDGHDVMRVLGMPPGPHVRGALERAARGSARRSVAQRARAAARATRVVARRARSTARRCLTPFAPTPISCRPNCRRASSPSGPQVTFHLDGAPSKSPVRRELERVQTQLRELFQTPIPILNQVGGHVLATRGKKFRPTLLLLVAKLRGSSGRRRRALRDRGRDGARRGTDPRRLGRPERFAARASRR